MAELDNDDRLITLGALAVQVQELRIELQIKKWLAACQDLRDKLEERERQLADAIADYLKWRKERENERT